MHAGGPTATAPTTHLFQHVEAPAPGSADGHEASVCTNTVALRPKVLHGNLSFHNSESACGHQQNANVESTLNSSNSHLTLLEKNHKKEHRQLHVAPLQPLQPYTDTDLLDDAEALESRVVILLLLLRIKLDHRLVVLARCRPRARPRPRRSVGFPLVL